MPLRPYQTALELDTLYAVSLRQPQSQDKNIWVKDGTVDVYISSGDLPTTLPADMQIIENGEDMAGQASFATIPVYIYIEQNTGTTTEIVISGFDVREIA